MTLGVLQILLAMESIKIRFVLILLSLKNCPNLYSSPGVCVSFGQILFEVLDVYLFFLDKRLFLFLLGLRK